MTQVMKPELRQSGGFQDALKLMRDVAIVKRRTDCAGENMTRFMPPITAR